MERKKLALLKVLILVSCLVSIHESIAQTSLNMKQAIEIAIANNYSLKADSMNLLVSDYKNRTVRANLLPQVNYYSKAEYNIAIPSTMLPGTIAGQPGKELVPVQFGTRYTMSQGVEIKQAIIDKSTRIQVNAADLNNQIALTRHHLTREELVYQAAISYYSLQANAELIRKTRKDFENLNDILSIAKAQYEGGVVKKIDYESLQISTANKESYLNQLQTNYAEQLTNFNYLLGIAPESPTVIEDSISRVGGLIEQGDLASQRLDIRLADQLIVSKESEIGSIRAEGKPVLNSYFRFNYQSQFNSTSNMFNNDYWSKSSTVGVSASISLFDGYRRKSRIQIAQSQLQQLKFQDEQARQLANTQWLTASETLRKDQYQAEITARNLALAEKVFNSRKALYAEGVTTLVELLDAENELSESRNLYIQAVINLQTSMVNVYKAKGTLLTEFLQSI
jgi:outer membrane protein TolC